MDVKKRKAELFKMLEEILGDAERLHANVVEALKDLNTVETEADARAFDESHNLEDGLKHIELF